MCILIVDLVFTSCAKVFAMKARLKVRLQRHISLPTVTKHAVPIGTFTKLGGVDCYVATPTAEYSKEKVLLYFPDALGMQSPNCQASAILLSVQSYRWLTNLLTNQLLADDFARNGFKTVVIDYFKGEPVPSELVFAPGGAENFDIPAWLGRHPPPEAVEIVRAVITALKAEGATKFASTGYCYGGRTGFDLGFTNELQVVTMAHPSLLKAEEDLKVRGGPTGECE